MTDSERFQADSDLRAEHQRATGDLDRLVRIAFKQGETLQLLGRALQAQAERAAPRKDDSGAWRWTYSPEGSQIAERELPEWQRVRDAAEEIGRLREEVANLDASMRLRKLL